jgi:multisubunit Na+/H+ antiporter MnhG subunit
LTGSSAAPERRRPSARVEKAIRLTTGSLIAVFVGFAAVILDSEVLGFVAVAIMLVAILIGPVVTRALGIDR